VRGGQKNRNVSGKVGGRKGIFEDPLLTLLSVSGVRGGAGGRGGFDGQWNEGKKEKPTIF